MKNELDYSVYIERYLDNEMSHDEKMWFTRELKGNPELKRELGLRGRLNDSIRETAVMDFRKQLEDVFEDTRVEIGDQHYQPFSRRRIATVTSSLVISVAVILLLFLSSRNWDNQKIYDKYFSPPEAGLTFRSEGNADAAELQTAMHFYETGNYEQALSHFENILRADPTRLGLNLYSGISQMEIKRYHEANKSFRKIIDNNYILYLEQAEWYLAFCYLMTDDIMRAREQFTIIGKRKGYYHHQAGKVLRKIR